MKLVAISRLRNEADIAEAFVRHHAAYFDKIIVIDDGSCDGTYETLQFLRKEGLPLVTLKVPVVGYEQSSYMTQLMRLAVDQFGADWIAPLDADEFIEPPNGETLADVLGVQQQQLFSIAWNNFEWRSEEDGLESNPVVRQKWRLPPSTDSDKVLIPAALVDQAIQLSQGNHDLVRFGLKLPRLPLPSVSVCHFPIRSVLQYASKVVVGYLQYLSMPNWDRQLGWHYIKPFQTFLDGGLDALRDRMPLDSRQYASSTTTDQDHVSRKQPLRYQGGPLKRPIANTAFLTNIVHCAEEIARERAELLRASPSDQTNLASRWARFKFGNEAQNKQRERPTSIDFEALQRQLAAVQQELARLSDDKAVLEKRLARYDRELLEARSQLATQNERANLPCESSEK